MDTLIDKLAKERAIVQATIKENKRHEASIQRILEEHGFNRLAPPQKGVDYFTPSEIEAMRQSIAALIPKPKDGVSPIVDYNTIFEYCFSEIVKRVDAIPPPKDGKQGPAGPKGDNATLDIQELVKQVLTALPTQKDKKLVIDRDQIIKLIDEEIKKIPPQPIRIGGSVASLRAMTDVDISRMPLDSKGNYIFNRYNLIVSTTAPSSPQVNDLWVDTN